MELETERLLMRQWREEDFEAYAEFRSKEETARFVGGVLNRHDAWRRFAATIGHWVLRGYGYWAVEEQETGRFVGGVGSETRNAHCRSCWLDIDVSKLVSCWADGRAVLRQSRLAA